MDKIARAREQEQMIFECLEKLNGGPVRATELSVICKIPLKQIMTTTTRLFKRSEIARRKVNGQVFIRSMVGDNDDGKITLPASWRHDAFAIQSTCHIATLGGIPMFEPELRQMWIQAKKSTKIGKIPDGMVNYSNIEKSPRYRIEAEWSRKSGDRNMNAMLRSAARHYHREGVITVFALPLGMPSVDHLLRLINAITRLRKADTDFSVMAPGTFQILTADFKSKTCLLHIKNPSFEIINEGRAMDILRAGATKRAKLVESIYNVEKFE